VSGTRSFVVAPYTTLDASLAVTGVNLAQPGFALTTHQRDVGLETTINRAELQLRGDLGPNLAAPIENIEEAMRRIGRLLTERRDTAQKKA
jgi:hypothetical protein